MKEDKVKKILKDSVKELDKLCSNILPDFEEEHIHELRTHVKKFRAFLRLITTDDKQPDVKLSKKFKNLYHIAGIIRDTQLMEKRIAGWKVELPAYKERLQADINLQKYFWKKHYNEKILKQLDDKITNHKFHDLHTNVLENFLKERISGISNVLKDEPDNEQIHEYRKKIKDMLYNVKLVKKKWNAAADVLEKYPLDKLEELADIIGNYNDDRIMLEQLSGFSSPDLQQEEHDTLMAIHKEGLAFLENKRPVMLEHLQNFIKQFS